ncbi:hypothetical protein L6Q96_18570 [Candidatus Binatia bacterium]|nr:hypothetical protein [Candidatus Binatia bacterium]
MRQVRWAGWTMAVAAVLMIPGVQSARADIESDKPAALVVYPDIEVDTGVGTDTVIRLTNTNESATVQVHCFYVDANYHCSGGFNDGAICNGNPAVCSAGGGLGFCVPGWLEVDFRARLTARQPIEWKASDGLSDYMLPLPYGVCALRPTRACTSDDQCKTSVGGPGGPCTQSNAGTRIPPVPEDPFVGELRCYVIDANGDPVKSTEANVLKGEVVTADTDGGASFTVKEYNAIGVQATGTVSAPSNELVLGGPEAEYNGCAKYLLLNHFFDGAENPVPGSDRNIYTELTLIPCTADYLRQIPGQAVVQYLVFNEYEQRFSTSRGVRCFDERLLSNIDTPNNSRSIFWAGVAGTLTGQTRMQSIGSGILAVATELHDRAPNGRQGDTATAAFNIHQNGSREAADVMTLP